MDMDMLAQLEQLHVNLGSNIVIGKIIVASVYYYF